MLALAPAASLILSLTATRWLSSAAGLGVMDLPNDVYVLAFVDDLENLVLAMWDGRNQPDVTYGVTAEGGADTTFTLDLPLPENTTGTTLFDQYGVELSSPGAGPSVQIVLTPSVQYLVVAR